MTNIIIVNDITLNELSFEVHGTLVKQAIHPLTLDLNGMIVDLNI
jgi:hypothetical protein